MTIAGGISYWIVGRGMMPWWMGFQTFGATLFAVNFLMRWHREFYFEYQLHKILTWGQFEISHGKRRILGEKDKALTLPDRRTKDDLDANWFSRYGEIRRQNDNNEILSTTDKKSYFY